MTRLINIYRIFPRPSNRIRLQAYLDKWPRAVSLASTDELRFLKTHEFKI